MRLNFRFPGRSGVGFVPPKLAKLGYVPYKYAYCELGGKQEAQAEARRLRKVGIPTRVARSGSERHDPVWYLYTKSKMPHR